MREAPKGSLHILPTSQHFHGFSYHRTPTTRQIYHFFHCVYHITCLATSNAVDGARAVVVAGGPSPYLYTQVEEEDAVTILEVGVVEETVVDVVEAAEHHVQSKSTGEMNLYLFMVYIS